VDHNFTTKTQSSQNIGDIRMRPLLEDITLSVIKREEPAANDDGLTPEEKTQLRELCVLIVISEFLESNSETEL
jgi:hypothetical protein